MILLALHAALLGLNPFNKYQRSLHFNKNLYLKITTYKEFPKTENMSN